MTNDADTERTQPASAHRITWFAPERPVENGTVFVRPEQATLPLASSPDNFVEH
jgi:hypothetical protein